MNRFLHLLLFVLISSTGPIAAASSSEQLPAFSPKLSGKLFTVKGSNTVGAALMPALVETYLQAKGARQISRIPLATENEMRISAQLDNGNRVYVDIAAHGSSTSFVALAEGSADLGMSSRRIKSKEAERLKFLGDMTQFGAENVVGIDGLAVIVNASNPIAQLSVDTIAKIFSGQITHWRELGGPDLAINLYARDDKSGTWDTFKSLVLAKKYRLAASAKRFESNDQLSARVSADPGAIGFVGLASVNQSKALAVSGRASQALSPTELTVATEDYALSRRLYLYLPPNANGLVREFVDFTQTATGQAQVAKVGYISQDPIAVEPDLAGIEDEGYLAAVKGASRLSVNIRFEAGSTELDNKAKQDIKRLVALTRQQGFGNQAIQLIGFGDAKASSSRAEVLSKLRATRVKSALYQQGVNTLPVQGFGAIMPVDGANKARNQRVEIWLREAN